jgi:hypothetical protein
MITLLENKTFSYEEIIPNDELSAYYGSKLPELNYYPFYDDLRPSSPTVVIYPLFTQAAYDWNGFHDYYSGRCDNCTTIKIPDYYEKSLAASGNGFRILEFLSYDTIDDIDLDKNPDILKKYDKVILLHNEFVTKKEFEAITSHPNVVYLYPNSLRSEVEVDYLRNTITLVRGPNLPHSGIISGFDWEFDNSEYFYDWSCKNWTFYKIDNGYMLNCYPETELPLYGHDILAAMKAL